MERESLWRIPLATLLVYAGTTLGCGVESKQMLPPPTAISTATGSRPPEPAATISPEAAWASLEPLERIKKLELKQYPEIPNFDSLAELTKAAAEFYCQSTNCTSSPQELIERVGFVTFEFFKTVIEQDIGRNLTGEEEKKAKDALNYIVSSKTKREIFWNLEALKTDVTNVSPEAIAKLEGRDLQTVIYKTVLLQGFFLLERSREEADYSIDTSILGKLKVSVRGFDLYGQRSDLSSAQTLFASEAFALFFTRRAVDEEMGPLISLHRSSREAADLIEKINQQSNLTTEELLIFFRGQRSIRALLKIWGQGDEEKGLLAMVIIGLRVKNVYSQQEAENGLKNLFSPRGAIT